MSDGWIEETMDTVANPPESVLEGIYPVMGGRDLDDGRSQVRLATGEVVSVDDLVWISEAVDGDVSVSPGHIGEVEVLITESVESGGEGS